MIYKEIWAEGEDEQKIITLAMGRLAALKTSVCPQVLVLLAFGGQFSWSGAMALA